jgi:hypothetical protein
MHLGAGSSGIPILALALHLLISELFMPISLGVASIIAKSYRGRLCGACSREIGDINRAGSQPGLLLQRGITLQWMQVSPDRLEETLSSAQVICFACHTASTLVREHPEPATDRRRPSDFHIPRSE